VELQPASAERQTPAATATASAAIKVEGRIDANLILPSPPTGGGGGPPTTGEKR